MSSSSSDDHESDTAPPRVSKDKKKEKKQASKKKRRRPSTEEEEDGEARLNSAEQDTTAAAAPVDTTTTAAAAAAAAARKPRKRKRKGKGKKDNDEDGGEEEEGGGDTTTTGGAGDDEASVLSTTPTSGPPPATVAATVYVEGIPYQASEDDVIRFFQDKGCGKVSAVRMPRYQDSGRPRGYAHVDFKKGEESVVKALALSGKNLMGRYLTVQRAQQPKGLASVAPPGEKPPGCDTVFVKNLPYNATEDVVRDAFTFCGKIKTVRLAIWQHTQQQKGFCYVQFEKEGAAEIAVKKQSSITVGGRPVFVDYETGTPKASYRAADGRHWNKVQAKAGRGGGGQTSHRPPPRK